MKGLSAHSAHSHRLAWLAAASLALLLSAGPAAAQDAALEGNDLNAASAAPEGAGGESAEATQLDPLAVPEQTAVAEVAVAPVVDAPLAPATGPAHRDDRGLARSLLDDARDASNEAAASREQQAGGSFSVFLLGAGLVVLAGWVLVKRQRKSGRGDVQLVKAVQTLRLGPKHLVSVLDIGGRQLVVAMTDQAVHVLAELTAGGDMAHSAAPPAAPRWGAAKLDALAATRNPDDAPMNGGQDFSRLFDELRRARNGRSAAPAARLAATGTSDASAAAPESREHELVRARLEALRRDARTR